MAGITDGREMDLNGMNVAVKNAAIEVRRGFIRKVYGLLSAQLLLTVGIATPIYMMGQTFIQENSWLLYLSLAVLCATMCCMCCCQEQLRKFPMNYIFLLVLTGAMSVLCGFASAMYNWQSVMLAAGVTVGIFVLMTAYACCTKTDFTGMGPYLMGALICLICFGFAISILQLCGVHVRWLTIAYDIIGVLLFTFYIVYDTQLIIGEYGGHKQQFGIDDYVFAALNLYLDIINLFLLLLNLFGQRR